MTRTMLAVAASALALTAGNAFADGEPAAVAAAAPAAVATPKWGGLWIGASVGLGLSRADVDHELDIHKKREKQECDSYGEGGCYEWYTYDTKYWNFSSEKDDDSHGTDVQGTIAVGYDREIRDGFLIGVFADYTFGEIEDDIKLGDAKFVKGYYDYNQYKYVKSHYEGRDREGSLEFDNIWAVGVRAGVVRDNLNLFYLTAGYTEADIDFSSRSWEDDDTLSGYFLGAGFERKIRDGLSLKAEYRFSDFEDVEFSKSSKSTSYNCYECYERKVFTERRDENVDIDTDIHSIRVGVAYTFGAREEAAPAPMK